MKRVNYLFFIALGIILTLFGFSFWFSSFALLLVNLLFSLIHISDDFGAMAILTCYFIGIIGLAIIIFGIIKYIVSKD